MEFASAPIDAERRNALETSPNTRHSTQAPFFNTANQAARRKIARDVAAMYDDIAREAEFEPIERRTAFAISMRLYERAGQPCETPRGVSLSAIGAALSSRSDDEKARVNTARNRVGQLFNQAIPRAGHQILTRYKAEEESGKPHEYSDHLLPIAALYSERLSEEIDRILATKGLDKKGKREKIVEARARLVAEAVACLPKCDTALISPDGETYAYVSAPEAQAYCKQKTAYTARAYTYTPPAPATLQKRPFYDQDLKRIEDKIKGFIEDQLDEILEHNSFDEARNFIATRLDKGIPKLLSSWVKVAGLRENTEEGGKRNNKYVIEIMGVAPTEPPGETPKIERGTPQNFGGVASGKSLDSSEIENPVFETAPEGDCLENGQKTTLVPGAPAADFVQNENGAELAPIAPASGASAEPDPVPALNFDSSLEAATFYARDGFPVLPVCQWEADAGRCTGEKHGPDCKGRKPLVKGDGSEGYSGATRDLGKIRDWFTRLFPRAGVAIRLDGHMAIDCDVKDNAGGLESYQILADTFALPDTLSAVTHSGGRHFIFRLPEGMPADWLKSWIRIGDKAGLPGIDLKVDTNGLLFVEPTCGPKGVYRWIDPCQVPATLPRACADFLHETRYKQNPEEKAKAKAGKPAASPSLQNLQCDQSKFFRDVPPGAGQHDRLRAIGVAIRCQTRASASEIADAMRWHASRFSTPLEDQRWIERTAKSIERSF